MTQCTNTRLGFERVRGTQRSPAKPALGAPVNCCGTAALSQPPAAVDDRSQRSSSSKTLSGPGPGSMASEQRQHRQLRKEAMFAIWNVRTMRSLGKVEIVEGEMERLHIGCLGISETRWSGKGHFVTDSGCTLVYSSTDAGGHAGVAVLLGKDWAKSLFGYNPISERVVTVRIAARPWNVTFIQAYAPTNQASEQDKQEFYACLQDVYSNSPKQDVVIVAGDMNAKIGEGAPIGKHALGERNDNGEKLIEFAQLNELAACNALVRRHPRRRYTWKSSDGVCRNQIDYILMNRRWLSSVCKCRSYPSSDGDTDHTLVGLKFKLKLHKIVSSEKRPQFEYSRAEQFRLELHNQYGILASLVEECDSETTIADPENTHSDISDKGNSLWCTLRDTVIETAKKTLTSRRKAPKRSWIKHETFVLIEEKRKCSRGSEDYHRYKRQVKSLLKRDKKEHFESICAEMENAKRTNKTKDLFQCMNRLTKQVCPTVKVVQSESGRVLTEDPDIMTRWKEYCEHLYSSSEVREDLRIGGNKEPTPSIEEVEKSAQRLEDRKSGGTGRGPSRIAQTRL